MTLEKQILKIVIADSSTWSTAESNYNKPTDKSM